MDCGRSKQQILSCGECDKSVKWLAPCSNCRIFFCRKSLHESAPIRSGKQILSKFCPVGIFWGHSINFGSTIGPSTRYRTSCKSFRCPVANSLLFTELMGWWINAPIFHRCRSLLRTQWPCTIVNPYYWCWSVFEVEVQRHRTTKSHK